MSEERIVTRSKPSAGTPRRRSLAALAALLCLTAGAFNVAGAPAAAAAASGGFARFDYLATDQNFKVPAAVTSVVVTAVGAAGGAGSQVAGSGAGAPGGLGGTASATVAVTPGQLLIVDVGGQGPDGKTDGGGVNPAGGGGSGIVGGAGGGSAGIAGGGGAGGGASTVKGVGVLVVAGGGGGGGGGGGFVGENGGSGGSGGRPPGNAGASGTGSGGGAGGVAGFFVSTNGANGQPAPVGDDGGGPGGGGGGVNLNLEAFGFAGGGLPGKGGGVGAGGGGGGGAGSSAVQESVNTPTFGTSTKSGNGSVTISWSAPTPTVSIGSSGNPSGGQVTFTATVTPPSGVTTAATGPVLFDIDNKYAGQGNLSSGSPGVAVFTAPSLAAGVHTVQAVYEGDTVYGVAESPALAQTVIDTTTLALAVTPNPVLLGQGLTLVATVTPTPAGPPPTGTVNFCGVSCYTGTLNGASPDQATLTTTVAALGFGAGPHTVTATYSGSAGTYIGSTATSSVTVATPTTLTIVTRTLTAGTVGVPYLAGLAATGGVAPYHWSISSGRLPAGLTLNTLTGTISGTPTAPTTAAFSVTTTDSTLGTPLSAVSPLSLKIASPPVTVNTGSLPPATVGTAYSTALASTGGTPGYTWSVTAGALPAGLTLNASTGAITGIPSIAGSATITVTATDSTSPTRLTGSKTLTLLVQPTVQPGVYVVNGGYSGLVSFPLGAGGNVSPHSQITGSQTGLLGTTGVAIDPTGRLYITNSGSNSVTEYPNQANGNAAPTTVIAGTNTGLTGPQADALDATGRLYVANQPANTVTVYAPGASGNIAPIATIAGTNTLLNGPQSLVIDPAGTLWVGNTNNTLTGYATGASGNIAPIATIAGTNTLLNGPQGLAIDGNGNLLVANIYGESLNEYPITSRGNVAPLRTISGAATGLDFPDGVDVDTSGNIYVSNQFGGSVTEYAAAASGNVAPTATIAGGSTGLSAPGHLAVAPPLSVLTAQLPTAAVGLSYHGTLEAGLGTPPYRWKVALGQLPIGLHLDSRSGAITGVARTVGKYQFQIQVSDESDPPMDAEAMLTLIVTGAP